MQTIALYNRQSQRLLTLREAEQKGYGPVITLKQRIRRGQLPAYKASYLWLVLEVALSRASRRRSPRKGG